MQSIVTIAQPAPTISASRALLLGAAAGMAETGLIPVGVTHGSAARTPL